MCFQCRYAPLQRCLSTDTVGVLRCLENRESENASSPRKKILPFRRHLLPFHFGTDSVVTGGKAPALTPCFKRICDNFPGKLLVIAFSSFYKRPNPSASSL